jgi:hypothetical protein
LGFSKSNDYQLIESKEIELHKNAHKTHISEDEFEKLLDTKKMKGRLGEEKVLLHEQNWLIENGQPDLANNVRRVSSTSISEGYDIISFDLDGNNKYIEVKSATGVDNKFYLTDNELNISSELKENYWIYQVIFSNSDTEDYRIIKTQDPSSKIESKEWSLTATSYLIEKL